MAPGISQEEFARLHPRRFAEAHSLDAAWPSVGASLRSRLIEEFYASLMAEGRYTHEEAMGMARLAAGTRRGTDPNTILPIGPVNQAVLERRGVRAPRQGPKAPPPRRSVVGMLRALDGSLPDEPPPPPAEPLRANARSRELISQYFVPDVAPPSRAVSQISMSPRQARMAGQILAAVLAGAGGLVGAGLSMEEDLTP
jgi:hypothetical protein